MRRALPALLLSVLVMAGCGSDDDTDPATDTTVTDEAETDAESGATEAETDGEADTEADAEADGTETDAEGEGDEAAASIEEIDAGLADLPFELANCGWDPEWDGTGGYTADGTVTNSLPEDNEVVVIVQFSAGGVLQGTASELLSPVAAGETASWAVGDIGDGAGQDAETECEVVSARKSR